VISFSNRVKKQIIQNSLQDESCIEAETYGLLLFSRLLDPHRNVYRTSQGCVARHAAELIASCCGVYVNVVDPTSEGEGRASYTVEIPFNEQRAAIAGKFGSEYSSIEPERLEDQEHKIAFLRGAFLAAGSVNDPVKSFHLEIAAHSAELCAQLCALMNSVGLHSRSSTRKTGSSAYIKGSADIELLLGEMGAAGGYMEVIEARINREVNNKANRTTNCDSANITKTINAAGEQVAAIRRIEKSMGLVSLPQELRQLAQLRLDNPEMTLRELGESLEPKLSRSGVNHRLQKIMDIAREIKN